MTESRSPARSRIGELGRFLEIQNLGLNLPLLLAFVALAYEAAPSLRSVALVLVAFVAARNAGHGFNRYIDRDLDAANPRAQQRALVTGVFSPGFALLVAGINSAILLTAAAFLNPLAAVLGPVALVLVLGYSYTKRFTSLTTIFLGLVESAVPAAVFIAFTGTVPLPVLFAVGGVLAWGAAFETVHSLGDLESDRALGLHSLPVQWGWQRSLNFVALNHSVALLLFGLFGYFERLDVFYFIAIAAMAVGVYLLNIRLRRRPRDTTEVFRGHFGLSLVYLTGVLLAVLIP